MKLYYTTDETIDENLEQVCPFNNEVSKTVRYVGSGACMNCPFCYGAGFNTSPYGIVHPRDLIMIPKYRRDKDVDKNWGTYHNFTKIENEKLELGIKQFFCVSKKDYVYCSKLLSEKRRNSFEIRFKRWTYLHIQIPLENVIRRIREVWLDLKIKIKY